MSLNWSYGDVEFLIIFCFFIIFLIFPINTHSESLKAGYHVNNDTAVWINNIDTINPTVYRYDVHHPQVRPILLQSYDGDMLSIACGFYCNGACDGFLFAVFTVCTYNGTVIDIGFCSPIVVWSANRDKLVKENATIELTGEGYLVLREVDGSIVWSTGTSGKSVVSLNITSDWNLVLFDRQNHAVWQSFEYPTDTLVVGQTLKGGQNLTSNSSATNSTQGQFYFTVFKTFGWPELRAYVVSDHPQRYYNNIFVTSPNGSINFTSGDNGEILSSASQLENITLFNGSLKVNGVELFQWSSASSFQYLRLDGDGHIRVYEISNSKGWVPVADILELDICDYPTVCGNYGVCSEGQCSCPLAPSNFFYPVNDLQANLGCNPVNVLSCGSIDDQKMITLENVKYFNQIDGIVNSTDDKGCREACSKNCSCKAAFFMYCDPNGKSGNCYLQSEVLSMHSIRPSESNVSYSVFIKVQTINKKSIKVILACVLSASFALLLAMSIIILLKRRKTSREEDELGQVPGIPIRFTMEELKIATANFTKKIGRGGFGSVFEGKIGDEMVAVKCLEGVGQGKKEFLAEVVTIGKLHHANLVTLVGFCAKNSQRLLVYDFMFNGSLDKWIFYKDQNLIPLSWRTRCKIISDIAKGLSYLHEDCKPRIAHLDIKPQNILLDENFNAKVSDFGLAKLIDRDQKQVMTKMRGTPGYLAPEWLTLIITVKADIYSFGIVIMEIVCGRRNLDYSQPEESNHLLALLQNKFQENQLLDIIDTNGIDIELHKEEVINMIKLAVHCLQIDANKRPSMSKVVKILEGEISMNTELDYNLVTNILANMTGENHQSCDRTDGLTIIRPQVRFGDWHC